MIEDLSDIDRVVHEPGRLLILAVLRAVERADFLFLLEQTGLTKGNLSSHMRKLEAVGYVDVEKTYVDRIPRTLYRLTDRGAAAIAEYRAQMERMLASLS